MNTVHEFLIMNANFEFCTECIKKLEETVFFHHKNINFFQGPCP